jgi:enoyl-CoA hydratase/carnithine racemase
MTGQPSADPPEATTRRTVVDGIATITLNRPDRRNAMTRDMVHQLCADFDAVDADDGIRAVIVTGAERSFCVGADLGNPTAFGRAEERADRMRRDVGGYLALRIFTCRKPVIAAVNGDAVGIGATMTLPMDIRLASTAARYMFPFTRRGIVPETCASWFLPRVVGISRALEWTMYGGLISADEVFQAGLVRSLHAPEELLPAAHAVAVRLTESGSPVSIGATRRLLWQGLTNGHPMESHQEESALLAALSGGPDATEGVRSFLEKRPAAFTSRPSTELVPFEGWWDVPEFSALSPDPRPERTRPVR